MSPLGEKLRICYAAGNLRGAGLGCRFMRMEGTDVWTKGKEIMEYRVEGEEKLNQSGRDREKRSVVG